MKSFFCTRCKKTVDLIYKGDVCICPKCRKVYPIKK